MPDIFISEEKKEEKKKVKENTPVEKEVKEILGKTLIKKDKKSLIASYLRNPKGVDFEIKDKKEKIELLLRMHPITNIKWILVSIVMIFAPVALKSFPILDFLPGNYRFIAILGWYLITTSFVLENILTWYFNVYIITDERIIDVDFYNLIYKDISSAEIERIQDVSYRMGGVTRTVFNYGDVFIQTAAEKPNFEFLAVPKPDKVVKLLQDLMIEEKQEAIEGRVR
ncbi:PH domain-containing protein [Patescibacteria group bacterium]|nr:PH domain-containing protein [Patescibacteria group bacterium]MBU2036543.1 PH domain-containing protein [Patescibacteria group bacterium]